MQTESHKKAISEGMKRFFLNGGTNGRLGKIGSEHQKQVVSNMFKGKPLSKEHKIKLSNSRIGMKFSESHCSNLAISRKKDRCPLFKGTHSQYASLHVWIKRHLPKLYCEHCKNTDKLQYANKSGLYKKDVSDFIVLCVKCHVKYDRAMMKEIIENDK